MKIIIKWALIFTFLCLLVLIGFVIYFNSEVELRENIDLHSASPINKELRFLNVSGDTLFFQEMGPTDSQTVLLIHGTGSWSEIWKETMINLAGKGFHVVALDIPPFGYSSKLNTAEEYSSANQAKRINEFISQLKHDSIIIVAHSVGAKSAIEAVLTNPSIYKKLLLIDPALSFSNDSTIIGFQNNNPSIFEKLFFSNSYLRDAFIGAFGTNPSMTKRNFQSFVWNKSCVTDSKVDMINKPMKIKNITMGYGLWLENLICRNFQSKISNINNLRYIQIPVRLIWGEEDEITPLWQGKQLSKFFKNSKLQVIKRSGHIPYIESPDEFNLELLKAISF